MAKRGLDSGVYYLCHYGRTQGMPWRRCSTVVSFRRLAGSWATKKANKEKGGAFEPQEWPADMAWAGGHVDKSPVVWWGLQGGGMFAGTLKGPDRGFRQTVDRREGFCG